MRSQQKKKKDMGVAQPQHPLTLRPGPAAFCEACERRSRQVLEHAADAYFLCDLKGRIRDTNTVACESLGYTKEELLALSAPDIMLSFGKIRATAFWKSMRLGDTAAFRVMHRKKSGSTFPVETLLTRVRLAEEDYLIALARDISEHEKRVAILRDGQRAAEQANRLKTLFLANTTHEIRTPMNAVIGLTDLLLTTQLNSRQRRYAETLRTSGDLLLKVIDDVLDYSALEAGELKLETALVDVEGVVESVLELLAERAYSKGIELACRYSTGSIHTMSDPHRLRQVLVNLVGNAVKFTERGQVVVDVSTATDESERGWLRVEVKDTGIGIEPQFEGDLFRPFARSHAAKAHAGNGMGLAIAKRLVELMGGEIGIKQRARGGANAWFRIPFKPLAGRGSAGLVGGLAGGKALVVDDNVTIAQTIKDCLSGLGMSIDIETDGQRALTRLLCR
ncbi:MAG TPA: ATP-binding protein, partial [Gammaproteobacteria bacterium]|nr:ATP-binding protein [Gammaproteobacteria bacterium]